MCLPNISCCITVESWRGIRKGGGEMGEIHEFAKKYAIILCLMNVIQSQNLVDTSIVHEMYVIDYRQNLFPPLGAIAWANK